MTEHDDHATVPVEPAALDARAADEYRAARERMTEIAGGLGSDDAARRVQACPDWSVHDLFSHVTGIAVDLSAGRLPEDGDTQAWVDRQVEERRGRTLVEVVDEWSEAGPRFESMITARPHRLWGLTYDLVVHEHDLRAALGRRAERSGAGVRTAARLGLRLVAGDLATNGLPGFRWVETDAPGGPVEHVVGDGKPELTLRASAFEALRLLGSRRTLAQLRAADIEGDIDRYLAGLVHMELPSADLGE